MIIITRSCFRLYHEVNVIKSDMPVVQMCDTKQINSHTIDPREDFAFLAHLALASCRLFCIWNQYYTRRVRE